MNFGVFSLLLYFTFQNMSENQVCKEGIVRGVSEGQVAVEIVVSSACGGCAAKSLCNITEKKNEIIEAKVLPGDSFIVGESVNIEMRQNVARKAVVLGYVLPFLMLVGGLFGTYAITHIEWLSVVAAIILITIYYLVIKLLDKKLTKDFDFYAVKLK